jgi:single-strand DNA-binding protein
MLTITGNGRLTRDPELRNTHNGDAVTTVSVASDRRDRQADPVYVDLILWRGQAEAAARHLVKGQTVTFSGRLDPRPWQTRSGDQRLALEVHDVAIEYGAKPRTAAAEPASSVARDDYVPAGADRDPDDIPF